MACSRPFRILNKNFQKQSFHDFNYNKKHFYEVPCGYCLNCRVDKRNFIEDMAKSEFSRFGNVGAFITLTFDDEHIFQNNLVNDNGVLRPTLRRKDLSNYLKDIRRQIEYHNLHNGKSINSNFHYVASGEYGDKSTNRCHYHICFLGLDWLVCQKLFMSCWKKGHVEVNPINNGGIRYCVKYIESIDYGKQAQAKYDDHGIERPFIVKSQHLGEKFILDNLEQIQNNNYCYVAKNNKLRPISSYLKNKLHARTSFDYSEQCKKLKSYGVKEDRPGNKKYKYSIMQINAFNHQLALQREASLNKQIERTGNSVTIPIDTQYTSNIDWSQIFPNGYSHHYDGKTYFYNNNHEIIDIIPF